MAQPLKALVTGKKLEGDVAKTEGQAHGLENSNNAKESPSLRKSQKFVTIIVSKGPNEETFYVYKDFICFHSPFFDAAFNGKFAEGQSHVMRLDDVDPVVFGFVVEWIYTQDFKDRSALQYIEALKLWILADRLLIPALQNKAMDVIVTIYNTLYVHGICLQHSGTWCVNLVYNTKCETMLKKVTAEKFAFGISSDLLEEWRPVLPQEMAMDIMMAYSRQYHGLRDVKKLKKPFTLSAADYYVAVKAGGGKKCAN